MTLLSTPIDKVYLTISLALLLTISITVVVNHHRGKVKGNKSSNAVNNGSGIVNQILNNDESNKAVSHGYSSPAVVNKGSGSVTINSYAINPNVSSRSVHSHKPEMSEQKEIRLSDLVTPTKAKIYNESFADAEILGPCIICPISGCTFNECNFSAITESMFIEIPEGWSGISGAIGLENCRFDRCNFKNVAFIGKRTLLTKIKAGISIKEER